MNIMDNMKRHLLEIFLVFWIILFPIFTYRLGLASSDNFPNRPINIGIDKAFAPMEWEENGKVMGFDIDIMDEISNYWNHPVQYIPMDWKYAYDSIKNSSIDCLFVTITPNRSEFMDYSYPIMNDTARIFVRENIVGLNNITDLTNHTVAMENDYAAAEYLLAHVSGINPVYVNTTVEALDMVAAGDVFAYFGKVNIARYFIDQLNITSIKMIGDEIKLQPTCIGVLKGNQTLLNETNKALQYLFDSGTYEKIYDRWYGTLIDPTEGINQNIYETILIILAIVGIAFVIALAVSYSLKKQVSLKTRELKEENQKLKKIENELRKTQEDLVQSRKMEAIGRFVGGIAHDFNNLLTVISGVSEMLWHSVPNKREELEDIIGASKKATSLTSQLLSFSRKQVINPKRVNLNEIIQQNLSMIQRLVGETIKITPNLALNLGYCNLDPNQIVQLLMNIIINSRDAMPKGGVIKILTENVDPQHLNWYKSLKGKENAKYCRLSIQDSGIGMTEDELKHVFEPFYTTKAMGKGTGLGLSTVYGIVKQHHGEINIHSKRGVGTEVEIYFPQVINAEIKEESHETSNSTKKFESKERSAKILVVEDEEMVRKFVIKALQLKNFTVIPARNPLEAFEIVDFTKDQIDLVITDVIMPFKNGKEMAKEIAQINPSIKILFISGYAEKIIVEHGVLAQGTHFLAKPFSPEELINKVVNVLSGTDV